MSPKTQNSQPIQQNQFAHKQDDSSKKELAKKEIAEIAKIANQIAEVDNLNHQPTPKKEETILMKSATIKLKNTFLDKK